MAEGSGPPGPPACARGAAAPARRRVAAARRAAVAADAGDDDLNRRAVEQLAKADGFDRLLAAVAADDRSRPPRAATRGSSVGMGDPRRAGWSARSSAPNPA